MSTMIATAPRAEAPELTAAKLYKQIITARVAAERTAGDLATAIADNAAAAAHLESLKTAYRAAKALTV